MASPTPLTTAPTPALPERVAITSDYTPEFTPHELDLIKEHTGRAYTQIIQDDNSDERLTVTAWLKLRRDGFDLSLADMRHVLIKLGGTEDPTNAGPPTDSPRSVTGGE